MGNIFSKMPYSAQAASELVSYAAAALFFLAPLPMIVRVCKRRKSVKQYSPLPYLAGFINQMLWVLYGIPAVHIHRHGLPPLPANMFGLLAEACFLAVFVVFNRNNRSRLILLILAELFFVGVLAVVLYVIQNHQYRSLIVGVLSVISGTIMHGCPLLFLFNTKRIPSYLSRFQTIYAVTWTIFGVLLSDAYLVIPHAIGSVLGIVHMVLHRYYLRSTFDEDKDKEKEDVEEEEGWVVRARRLGSSEREFTILIVYPESRRGQQFNCSPLVESGDTIGTVITLTAE